MRHSVLIIEDEQIQAVSMQEYLQEERPYLLVNIATTQQEIETKIENLYYDIAVIDLQFKGFQFDGIHVAKKVLQLNPFAKIVIVSGWTNEYKRDIDLLLELKTDKVWGVIDKKSKQIETNMKVLEIVDKVVKSFDEKPFLHQKNLESLYAEAKNETDKFSKGTKFERFVGFLFSQMGFTHISKRVKDQSLGEVDLIVRNELNDLFFQKFKPYLLIECKNTAEKVDINDFKLFYGKLEHTNGMANLGFLITSNTIKDTAYKEAMRTSGKGNKVIFVTHLEIARLIQSSNLLDTMKSIIDEQVKDN
jgi:CheY-like chemotaxis protein